MILLVAHDVGELHPIPAAAVCGQRLEYVPVLGADRADEHESELGGERYGLDEVVGRLRRRDDPERSDEVRVAVTAVGGRRDRQGERHVGAPPAVELDQVGGVRRVDEHRRRRPREVADHRNAVLLQLGQVEAATRSDIVGVPARVHTMQRLVEPAGSEVGSEAGHLPVEAVETGIVQHHRPRTTLEELGVEEVVLAVPEEVHDLVEGIAQPLDLFEHREPFHLDVSGELDGLGQRGGEEGEIDVPGHGREEMAGVHRRAGGFRRDRRDDCHARPPGATTAMEDALLGFDHLGEPCAGGVPVELRRGVARRQSLTEVVVHDALEQDVCHGGHRRGVEPCLVERHEFAKRGVVAADHRGAAPAGLEHRQPEALVQRRKDDEVRRLVQLDEHLVRHVSGEGDLAGNPEVVERPAQVVELCGVDVTLHDQLAGSSYLGIERRVGLEQAVEVLAPLDAAGHEHEVLRQIGDRAADPLHQGRRRVGGGHELGAGPAVDGRDTARRNVCVRDHIVGRRVGDADDVARGAQHRHAHQVVGGLLGILEVYLGEQHGDEVVDRRDHAGPARHQGFRQDLREGECLER